MFEPVVLRVVRGIREAIGARQIKDGAACGRKNGGECGAHGVIGRQKHHVEVLSGCGGIRERLQREVGAAGEAGVNGGDGFSGIGTSLGHIKMRDGDVGVI